MPAPRTTTTPTPRRDALVVLAAAWLLVGGLWWLTPSTPTPGPGIEPAYRVHVNTADAATLRLLPGVGARLADNVIAHREAHGPFATPADLEAVPRIGPVLRRRMTPWVTFNSPSAAPPDAAAATPR
ncbi:MAG: helix-hairpin-helix domain-containing protein [Planctomycetota bacterium]